MVGDTCARAPGEALRQRHEENTQRLRRQITDAIAEEAAAHPKRVRAGVDQLTAELPRGLSVLLRSRAMRPARDSGKRSRGRRPFHPACMELYRIYDRVAGPPDARGWRRVAGQTRAYFAQSIGYKVRRLQMFDNMLCAIGLAQNAGYADFGDKPKRYIDRNGKKRKQPRDRRMTYLLPASETFLAQVVEALINGHEPPKLVDPSHIAGNQLPTDLLPPFSTGDQVDTWQLVEDPPTSIHASRAFTLCASSEGPPPIDKAMGKVGGAVAPPEDRLRLEPHRNALANKQTPAPDRPTAGQRRGKSARSGPQDDGFSDGATSNSMRGRSAAPQSHHSYDRAHTRNASGAAGDPIGRPRRPPPSPAASGRSPRPPARFEAASGRSVRADATAARTLPDKLPPAIERASVDESGNPARPHLAPCGCGECQNWARLVVRAPSQPSAASTAVAPAARGSSPTPAEGETQTVAALAACGWSPRIEVFKDLRDPELDVYARAHVIKAIDSGALPDPVPADDSDAWPYAVKAAWKKLRAQRKFPLADAYGTMFAERIEARRRAEYETHADNCRCELCTGQRRTDEWFASRPHPFPCICQSCEEWMDLFSLSGGK
jgi:hypothetical protein